jgi:hypothetical protein
LQCPTKNTQEFFRLLYDVVNHEHVNDIPEGEVFYLWKRLLIEKLRVKASELTRETGAEELDVFLHKLSTIRASLPPLWDTDFAVLPLSTPTFIYLKHYASSLINVMNCEHLLPLKTCETIHSILNT